MQEIAIEKIDKLTKKLKPSSQKVGSNSKGHKQ